MSQNVAANSQQLTSEERFVNSGVQVTTKKLGVVTMRELCLEDVQKLSKEILTLLLLAKSNDAASENEFLTLLVSSPQAATVIKSLFAASSSLPDENFNRLPISDTAKLIQGFLIVNNIQELKELFLETLKMLNLSVKASLEQNQNT